MSLIVQKFGGTSVANAERLHVVAERIKFNIERGHQVVVTVSAMGDSTDKLVALARQVQSKDEAEREACAREMDVLLASGEQVSSSLLAMTLKKLGVAARSLLGYQVAIRTSNKHQRARIEAIESQRIQDCLENNEVAIIAGFQGVDEHGDVTTLGRGGTDTTAVALASTLDAQECQIFTDVDGIYTTDPRIEPKARRLERITFEEMLELSSMGSQVMQTRAMEFANKYQVPIRVLSSFDDDYDTTGKGTLITKDYSSNADGIEAPLVSGIAFTRDEAEIHVRDVPNKPGMAFKIIDAVAQADIEVDMIVQTATRDGKVDFSFTLHRDHCALAKQRVEQIASQYDFGEVVSNSKVVKLSVVGVGMRSHAGIASRIFEALAAENINIRLISTSEIKVSVLVDEHQLEKGVRVLHNAFELDKPKEH